jgi:hypothetical protein
MKLTQRRVAAHKASSSWQPLKEVNNSKTDSLIGTQSRFSSKPKRVWIYSSPKVIDLSEQTFDTFGKTIVTPGLCSEDISDMSIESSVSSDSSVSEIIHWLLSDESE